MFKRLLMHMIFGIAAGDTDTSQDYEYTDWDAVERFRMFLHSVSNKRKRYLLLRVNEVFS
jgi:menaquinone-dependent protoporphyrinogen oxidase